MKLIIFGATGSLGRHLVRQALDRGHQVTAFSRDPAALDVAHPGLTRRAGDVRDPRSVDDAVAGHDAVVFALGAGRKGALRSLGTRHVIAAMRRHGVGRLVAVSTLGTGDSRGLLDFFWRRVMFGLLLRDAYADHVAQEAAIRESGLDWIIVRPGAYTDGPATGDYWHGHPRDAKPVALKIARADLASFLLDQLTSDQYLNQAPIVSYPRGRYTEKSTAAGNEGSPSPSMGEGTGVRVKTRSAQSKP